MFYIFLDENNRKMILPASQVIRVEEISKGVFEIFLEGDSFSTSELALSDNAKTISNFLLSRDPVNFIKGGWG